MGPTESCKKKYGCYLLFSPAHSAHSFLKEKIWMLSIFFGLHTLHTLTTASCKKKYGCSLFFWPAHIAHTSHSILQEKNMDALYYFGLHTSHTLPTASCKKKIWMLPIIFHCTHRTRYPHQSKPPGMTGLYVSIIFTCTHRTHRTPYPHLFERKNMDALYFSGLHTSHTLPTASCKKKYGCYLLFSPAHTELPHTLPTLVQTTHYDRN